MTNYKPITVSEETRKTLRMEKARRDMSSYNDLLIEELDFLSNDSKTEAKAD